MSVKGSQHTDSQFPIWHKDKNACICIVKKIFDPAYCFRSITNDWLFWKNWSLDHLISMFLSVYYKSILQFEPFIRLGHFAYRFHTQSLVERRWSWLCMTLTASPNMMLLVTLGCRWIKWTSVIWRRSGETFRKLRKRR